MFKQLVTRFLIQPSEVAKMPLHAVNVLFEEDEGPEIITLADTVALQRYMASHGH